jgi:AsmA protein
MNPAVKWIDLRRRLRRVLRSLMRSGPHEASTEQPAAPAAAEAQSALQLNVARIDVEDSTLVFEDTRSGTRQEITGLSLRGEGINLAGDPFRLEAAALLRMDSGKQELRVQLGSGISADLEAGSIALTDATLTLNPSDAPAMQLRLPAASIDLEARQAGLPSLSMSASGLDAVFGIDADWNDGLSAKGKAEVRKLDLQALLKGFGQALPAALNPQPLQDISLGSEFVLDESKLALEALKLRAGSFNGSGSLTLARAGGTRIDAVFQSPELDLDYLLAPALEAPVTANTAQATPPPASDIASLLTLDGNIVASLGKLKSGKLELGDLRATLELRKGSATLRQLAATLHGGSLGADGKLTADADSGAMALNAELKDVNLNALLQATQDIDKLEGRINGSLQLAATGRSIEDWTRSLRGPVQLRIDDPVLKDVSVEEVICKAAAQLNQEALSATFEQQTRFHSLETSLDFADGVGTLRKLGATVPNMSMRGEGRIDLPRRRIDIQLNTRVSNDLEQLDHACRMSRKMLAIEWPVSCKGSFDEEPKKWCGIDKDDLSRIAAQMATQKVQDKVMDKLDKFFKRGN